MLIVVVLGVLILCVRIGERRWRALGLDLDGKERLSGLAPSDAGGDR